jgi:hypothetical protein
MTVSPNIVIMTKDELEAVKREAFQRGVRRGEFEIGSKNCRGASDGECSWWLCPQNQAGEPAKSGRHCPLDTKEDRD